MYGRSGPSKRSAAFVWDHDLTGVAETRSSTKSLRQLTLLRVWSHIGNHSAIRPSMAFPARGSRRQREFSGDVRFPGLRLLRCGDRAELFPERERIRLAGAISGDLRRGLSDEAAGGDRAGRLY